MKRSVAMKWVEALRSGKYRQGRFFLRSAGNKYCCLGVLSEILGVHPEIASYTSLPVEMQEQVGIRDQDWFSDANDSERCSFDDIAMTIEVCSKDL